MVGRRRKRVRSEKRVRRDGDGLDNFNRRIVDHGWASPDGWPVGTGAGAGWRLSEPEARGKVDFLDREMGGWWAFGGDGGEAVTFVRCPYSPPHL